MGEFLLNARDNLKIAFKSVRFNWKQYSSFFAALFLIQCFFGMLTISSDLNTAITEDIIFDEYDYDIVLLDLSYSQTVFLQNDEIRVFASDHIYNIVRIVDHYHAADSSTTYDVYIDFIGPNMETDFKMFRKRYIPYLQQGMSSGQTIKYNYSEIYKLTSYKLGNLVSYVAFAAIMTVVSILLITSIYRIRVNHYKFQYGIYMAFGADFRQLCKTSFWEMMVVSLITFIPSQAFSTFIIWLIYRGEDFEFGYDPFALLKVFIINIIIVLVSVCFPMWRVSRNDVTNLIVTEDNSNLVVSPRRSFNFFKLDFPRKYELASMWRFRRYLSVMVLTAVGFSAVFVSGFYVSDLYAYCRDFSQPQFVATLATNSTYDDELIGDIAQIDGISQIAAYAEADALSYRSHILIESGSVLPSANMVSADDGFRATSDINCILADKSLIDALTSDLWNYKITGDPYEILSDDTAVIVTNYIGNKKVCNYKLGDTVKIGIFTGQKRAIDQNLTGSNRLRQELAYYNMDYVELKVCAIIDGMSTLDGAPVYLPKSVYRQFVHDDSAEVQTIDIYVDYSAELAKVKQTFDDIRAYTSLYNGRISIVDNHTSSNYKITKSMNYYALIIAISFLVLAISPLIWFFSQTLFVKKREKEFSVLIWLGTIKADIKRLSRQNGLILAGVSVAVCSLLSWGVISLIQLAVTRIPPALYGGIHSYYYGVRIPIIAMAVSVILSILCGYFSSMLPLSGFLKRFAETENNREYAGEE
ncbi:MAG: ABC transporter permease [Clostridiales bacterium]|nr:ABC transporter permease [Clostridiales bacterium]